MGVVRRHPLLAVAAGALLVVAGVLGGTGVAVWRAAHEDGAARLGRADAILVLGAAQYGGRPSPVFIGRLEHARLLWRQGRAEVILVLGAGQPGEPTTEAEAGRDYLIAQGLPAGAVQAVPVGHTTLQSLRAAARLMRDQGWETAFLVSDPWHNLRIERMARDLGIRGYASATWRSAARTRRTRLEGYLRETLAYLYYRLFRR